MARERGMQPGGNDGGSGTRPAAPLSGIKAAWRFLDRLHRGIGRRLLINVLLFSSAVTLVLTLLQLYIDYRHGIAAIDRRLSEIEGSYVGSLDEGLWSLDRRQLELQIAGILRLPAIRFAEVRETTDRADPMVVTAGRRQERAVIRREFPLVHEFHGQELQLGVLSVEATLDEVYGALLNEAIVILISQGAKTFLVSFFILYITRRLVTRHLTALAGFLGRYSLRQPLPPLRLQRQPPQEKDELDQVVTAFETMRQSLERAYDALRDSEQRFRDYAETASDWFWATGPDHRFNYFSEQVDPINRDKLIGSCRWEVAADLESEPEKWRRHRATLERHEPFRDFVYEGRRYRDHAPGGTAVFMSISGKPVFDADGRFTGYRGVARDITRGRRAEEALRRSEAYLAEAQRLSHTGSWAYNVARRKITHCSQEIYRLYGLDPAGGTPSFEMVRRRIHPEDRNRLGRRFNQALQRQTDFEVDLRVVLPDGTTEWVHSIGHPVFGDAGDIVEYVGTSMDVTERKRAEEERQANLWFFQSMDRVNRAIQGTNEPERMMSDVLDIVLSVFDCDRAWLAYPCDPESPTWRAQMEHTRPEFPGAFALGVDLPVDAAVAEVFRSARAADGAVRFGPGAPRPVPPQLATDFSVQSIIVMAVYPKVDKPYLFGLHQCSHPRLWTAAEERLFQEVGHRLGDALTSLLMVRNLRESEAKLEEAQRIVHVGYWDRDLVTDRVTWSNEAYRIFGLVPQGRTISFATLQQMVHPQDRGMMVRAVAEAVQGGRRYDVEYRLIRPDGEMRIVHSQGDVTRDAPGRPRRIFGTLQDITERKRAEERLRETEQRYSQVQMELAHVNRVTTMGQMTASIAHEVNQPIAGAVTNAEAALRWLAAEPANLEEVRLALGRIVRDGNRAGDVLGRIRALIKNLPPRLDWLDINETILEVLALARGELLRNGVALETVLAPGLPRIHGDRVQLQQVMLNLIVNAVEAMGGVGVGLRELSIATEREAAALSVTVRDSGPGLNPDSFEHLFEAFYTTKPDGMGMGLSICRSIIESHGGRIWATANAGPGAGFHFTLPTPCPDPNTQEPDGFATGGGAA